MSNDKMREEFEAWYLSEVFGGAEGCRHYLRREPCGGYLHASPQDFWKGWQASRAALVIELPAYFEYDHPCEAVGVLKGCREAIEAAGLKVKP